MDDPDATSSPSRPSAHTDRGRLAGQELFDSPQPIEDLLDHLGDAIFHIEDGVIRWVSGSVTRLLGWVPDDLIGKPSEYLIRGDDQEVLDEIRRNPIDDAVGTYRIEMRAADGGWRWVDNLIRPVTTDEAHRSFVVVARDATADVMRDLAVARAESRFSTVLNTLRDPVLIVDGEARIVFASDAILKWGYEPQALTGTPLHHRLPTAEAGAVRDLIGLMVADELPSGSMFTEMLDARGRAVPVELSLANRLGDESVQGIVISIRDRTADVRAVVRLAASEATSRFLADNAINVLLRLDAATHVVLATTSSGTVLGVGPDELRGQRLIDLIDEQHHDLVQASLDEATESGRSAQREVQARRVEGRPVTWLEMSVKGVSTADGTIEYHVTLADVGERRRLQREREEAAELFEIAFDAAPTGMTLWGVDPDRMEVVRVNAAYRAITGRSVEDLAATDVPTIIDAAYLPALIEGRDRLLSGATDSHQLDIRQLHRDGHWMWVSLTRSVVRDAAGAPRYIVAQVEDIGERKLEEERVAVLASTDELTQLANRRQFDARLASAYAHARETGGRLAVMYVDLDHFKVVNDELGHEAGDDLLREIAGALRAVTRPSDVVARLGGDEFAVIAESVDEADTREIAERIVHAVDFVRVLPSGSDHHVTASLGIALLAPSSDDVSGPDLLSRADRAMYRSKRAGRATWSL